jgi:hypothetical protein
MDDHKLDLAVKKEILINSFLLSKLVNLFLLIIVLNLKVLDFSFFIQAVILMLCSDNNFRSRSP